MTHRSLVVFAISCFLMGSLLAGCSSFGTHASNGPITTPGLPPIFVAGSEWYLPWESDSRVKGTTFHISPEGKVTVKKNDVIVPAKIENNEIVLEGVLEGCSIYTMNLQTVGWVFIKGKGNESSSGKLGQFKKHSKQ